MVTTEERHILKMVCAFFIVCAFGLLLGCENIVPIQCFVNQFGFRASSKGAEQVESVICAFADGNTDSDSFFFLLVHNGNFFVRMVCRFGLMLLLVAEKTVFSNFVLYCVVIVYIFGGLQSYKRDTIRNVFYHYYRIWASDVFLDILIVG